MSERVEKPADDPCWDRDTLVALLHVMLRRAGGRVEITGAELDAATWESATRDVIISGPPASEAWGSRVIASLSIEAKQRTARTT